MLKISQNNDNRGRHLEFYFHTGIGNWFQCFPVYPALNLRSSSVSGSGSGFRILAFPYAMVTGQIEPCIIRGRRLIGGCAYFSKHGNCFHVFSKQWFRIFTNMPRPNVNHVVQYLIISVSCINTQCHIHADWLHTSTRRLGYLAYNNKLNWRILAMSKISL